MRSSVMQAKLAAELLTDPIGIGWAAMSAEQIADPENPSGINYPNRRAPIAAKDVRRYLLMAGKWAKIEFDAAHSTVESVALPCITLTAALGSFEDFDVTDPAVLAAVDGALAALLETTGTGHISANDKAAILALADNRQSRAQELKLHKVAVGDVELARA